MNDKQISDFIKSHKQEVPDGGFEARLFETLKYMPKTGRAGKISTSSIIVALFGIAGITLFVLLGGASAIGEYFPSGSDFLIGGVNLTSELIISALFTLLITGIGTIAFDEL